MEGFEVRLKAGRYGNQAKGHTAFLLSCVYNSNRPYRAGYICVNYEQLKVRMQQFRELLDDAGIGYVLRKHDKIIEIDQCTIYFISKDNGTEKLMGQEWNKHFITGDHS